MTNEAVTTALAVRDETSAVMLTNHQLTMIANTQFVPAAFRGNVPAVLACVATGRALGLPDMTALRGINVIDGKASLSAELMDALVRSHGHSITGTVTDTEAVVRGKRADNGDEMEARFTLEMAQQAGLTGKSNWKKHPDDMLWARAVSKLCRRLFADCFAGATYVPEELEATADELMDESPPLVPPNVDEQEVYEGLADESLTGPGATTPLSRPDAAAAVPGTVNDLADLLSRAEDAGYGMEDLSAKARELFPERKVGDELSVEQLNEMWNGLHQEALEV